MSWLDIILLNVVVGVVFYWIFFNFGLFDLFSFSVVLKMGYFLVLRGSIVGRSVCFRV